MTPVNRLLTLLSLTAVVITLERLSPTTDILLPPRDFLHLHELVQMGVITTFSVVITFILLRVISDSFLLLRDIVGTIIGLLFVLGTYFYATGNGAHEVASFLFNQYCDTAKVGTGVCGSLYIDDYYFGNIVYFVGLGLSNLALILLELRRAAVPNGDRTTRVTLINAAVLALTFIAYDAFDRVPVGLLSTIVFSVVYACLLLRSNVSFRMLPFSVYSALGFSLAALVSIPLRLAISL